MIKNERQYRITKSQADKFGEALSRLDTSSQAAQLHPLLRKAQEDALRSQLEELRAQIEEYEALRSGRRAVLSVESFQDLPRALIQARIAAGLTQKELADRLGLKEQQVQQYEATEYASASVSRLQSVIDALGVHVREDVFLPTANVSLSALLRRLGNIGLEKDFLLRRLLPRPLAAAIREREGDAEAHTGLALQAASAVSKILKVNPSALVGSSPLSLSPAAASTARFKMPARINEQKTLAYVLYAHYIALLALEATQEIPQRNVPTDPEIARQEILAAYGGVTLEAVLRYVWDLGIPVVPLLDSTSFHGALWRIDGRNVIVAKHQARFPALWLNLILHETYHAAQEPEAPERTVIEEDDVLRGQRESDEETDAAYFAEDVLFDSRADQIAGKVAQRAQHRTQNLTRIVPQVAAEEGVPADALAYYIAYRMSKEKQDWWGAATNLQDRNTDAWEVARHIFLERSNLSLLNEADRAVLLQALTAEE